MCIGALSHISLHVCLSPQSQAPLPSVQLTVSVLQDLLQYSSQLPELAREVGLNSILGILTSLMGLKAEVSPDGPSLPSGRTAVKPCTAKAFWWGLARAMSYLTDTLRKLAW